jgi:hypothetical protein
MFAIVPCVLLPAGRRRVSAVGRLILLMEGYFGQFLGRYMTYQAAIHK